MNPSNQYPPNPYAPNAFAGIQPNPQRFQDRSFNYIYDFTLTALQQLTDQVSIDTDADFLLEAWYIATATSTFTIQLTDSTGYQLQSGPIQSAGLSQSQADPTVFSPSHPFPAGGKIQIQITDTSNAGNTGQIVFIGTKRFIVGGKQ